MTIEEALHELKIQSQVLESMILYNKDFEPRNDNTSLENKKNAIDMAIAALEKQIPKKPYIQQVEVDYYEHDCYERPSSDSFLGYVSECKEEHYQNNYCVGCGQHIDWSEVEKC